jgi:hypothetical protein
MSSPSTRTSNTPPPPSMSVAVTPQARSILAARLTAAGR